ncbi:MAG TPA: hypothetical protein VEX68_13880 [Bryobacteraceae bacterium]|nr:hypothetical protein [Bryobacteraceae bacterium]
MSFLTRWTAPRKLVEYARDLCGDDELVGRAHLSKVRTAAVVYSTSRAAEVAILKAEELEAVSAVAPTL